MRMLSRIWRPTGVAPSPHAARHFHKTQFFLHRHLSTKSMPVLRKEIEGGIEKDITQDELFKFTRYRWLYDEPPQLAARYRTFNVPALVDAAVEAAGNGARYYVVLKLLERQHNKAFLITMNNGDEVVARVPNPNAGPPFYTTASEVASRNFIQKALPLPVPKVKAYSCNSDNPVGAEYIIEEKAPGQRLSEFWDDLSFEQQKIIMRDIVMFETVMTSAIFHGHGSIYHKNDLAAKPARTMDLEVVYTSAEHLPDFDRSVTRDYVLGPSLEAGLWEDERSLLNLDRGPWNQPVECMIALGLSEQGWTKKFGEPQINPYSGLQETPDEYMALLQKYIDILPHIWFPPLRPRLALRNLNLENIFVDPGTMRLTSVIGWQGAVVSEPYFHDVYPPFLRVQGDPLYLYETLSKAIDNDKWEGKRFQHRDRLVNPAKHVIKAYKTDNVAPFRQSLLDLTGDWPKMKSKMSNATQRPISFSQDELRKHAAAWSFQKALGGWTDMLNHSKLLPYGGMVP